MAGAGVIMAAKLASSTEKGGVFTKIGTNNDVTIFRLLLSATGFL